jgi:transposase
MVHRTARVALRVTPAQRRRCFDQLRSGGDVWACVLELNAIRRRRSAPPVVGYQALCRELAVAGPGCFGELSAVAARSVLRRYADAWFAAAKARREGHASARFPRRRSHLLPLRFYAGTFSLTARRLRLPVTAGAAPLALRLARAVPYEVGQVRSVTLGHDGRRLHVDVTAEVPVEDHHLDPDRVAGVDLGITATHAGRRHNLALRSWRPAHLLAVLRDKAEVAGIAIALVDERGTSSTCPQCSARTTKPKGRVFACVRCGHSEHRDVVGARNIAAKGCGSTSAPALVTHRRAGRHMPGRTRRDPRRVRMDNRSGLWPAVARSEASESRSSSAVLLGEEPPTADRQGERLWLRH